MLGAVKSPQSCNNQLRQKGEQMDVLTKEGKEFSLKAQVGAALKRQGLQESHVIWETPKGGFIGIENDDPRTGQDHSLPKETTKKKKYPCKVYRANCDEENRDLVIKVTANGPHERAVFKPGEEKDLTETQINISGGEGPYEAGHIIGDNVELNRSSAH